MQINIENEKWKRIRKRNVIVKELGIPVNAMNRKNDIAHFINVCVAITNSSSSDTGFKKAYLKTPKKVW